MLVEYLPILVLFVLVSLVGLVAVNIPRFVAPRRPSLAKLAPYESGMSPVGPAWKRVPIRFYLTAMLFVLFDVEIVFFYPWAVALHRLRAYGLADEPMPDDDGARDAHLARLVEARVSNLEVANTASQALVTAIGGGAMARSHPAQRLAREAMFYGVQAQTGAIRRASLRRLSGDRPRTAS